MNIYINHDDKHKLLNLLSNYYHEINFTSIDKADFVNEITNTEAGAVELSFKELASDSISQKKITDKDIVSSENLKLIYDFFSKSGLEPSYGVLSGVRPLKLIHKSLDDDMILTDMYKNLYEKYRLSQFKVDELYGIAKLQRQYLSKDNDKLSLYISIPFCASRCIYCSFPSYILDKHRLEIEQYVDQIIIELDLLKQKLVDYHKEIDIVYIGGGTPAVLNLAQFKKLFTKINEIIGVNNLKEFTVEAGRPEFIDKNMLDLFKAFKVSRISINPQTMNDKTLKLINREHTVQDVHKAFNLASSDYDFDINMDVIVGLPSEEVADVDKTITEILKLKPANITVHSLAVKSSSKLKKSVDSYHFEKKHLLIDAMENIKKSCSLASYKPYYLYRQKNMLGSFENIGYALQDRQCIYNIRILEERHSIIALGVGSVSKAVKKDGSLERLANFKSIRDYLTKPEKMKETINNFFDYI